MPTIRLFRPSGSVKLEPRRNEPVKVSLRSLRPQEVPDEPDEPINNDDYQPYEPHQHCQCEQPIIFAVPDGPWDDFVPTCFRCGKVDLRTTPELDKPVDEEIVSEAHLVDEDAEESEGSLPAPNTSHHNAKKTHCPKGHPYNDANTKLTRQRGGRYARRRCRECERLGQRRRRAAKKMAGK